MTMTRHVSLLPFPSPEASSPTLPNHPREWRHRGDPQTNPPLIHHLLRPTNATKAHTTAPPPFWDTRPWARVTFAIPLWKQAVVALPSGIGGVIKLRDFRGPINPPINLPSWGICRRFFRVWFDTIRTGTEGRIRCCKRIIVQQEKSKGWG